MDKHHSCRSSWYLHVNSLRGHKDRGLFIWKNPQLSGRFSLEDYTWQGGCSLLGSSWTFTVGIHLWGVSEEYEDCTVHYVQSTLIFPTLDFRICSATCWFNADIQWERLIRTWPILDNVPFICTLLLSSVSSPLGPPSHLGFSAVKQLQVSLPGRFYLHLNSAAPPAVAGSTGSAVLSAKQTVNSRFMSSGCDTSTTLRP